MPGSFAARPPTSDVDALAVAGAEKKPEPNQPIVYAPMAKNAT